MTQPKTTKTRFWQISLRETLLLIVTICALLALFGRHAKSDVTGFYIGFDDEAVFAGIFTDLGIKLDVSSRSTHTSGRHANNPYPFPYAIRTVNTSFRSVTSDDALKIMSCLYDEMKDQLEDSGCEIHGEARSTGSTGPKDFHFEYRRGPVYGTAFAMPDAKPIDGDLEQVRIRIVIQEYIVGS